LYDLTWNSLPRGFFEGVDAVVHGAMARQGARRGGIDDNIAGSTLLLDEARKHGVERVAFLSSLAAHESALSGYGRQKYYLERLFSEHGYLVIRPGLVLGDGGIFGSMHAYLQTHRFIPLIGGGSQPLQTIYAGDLAEIVYTAIDRDNRGVITAAEAEPISYRMFYRTLCERMNVSPAFVPVPFWAADLAVSSAELLKIVLPIDRDNILGLKAMRADDGPRPQSGGPPIRDYSQNIDLALADIERSESRPGTYNDEVK
jgi:nucleoside-diphosphate-sugar epimerase